MVTSSAAPKSFTDVPDSVEAAHLATRALAQIAEDDWCREPLVHKGGRAAGVYKDARDPAALGAQRSVMIGARLAQHPHKLMRSRLAALATASARTLEAACQAGKTAGQS